MRSVLVRYHVSVYAKVDLETGEVVRVIVDDERMFGPDTRGGLFDDEMGQIADQETQKKAVAIAEKGEWPAWEVTGDQDPGRARITESSHAGDRPSDKTISHAWDELERRLRHAARRIPWKVLRLLSDAYPTSWFRKIMADELQTRRPTGNPPGHRTAAPVAPSRLRPRKIGLTKPTRRTRSRRRAPAGDRVGLREGGPARGHSANASRGKQAWLQIRRSALPVH